MRDAMSSLLFLLNRTLRIFDSRLPSDVSSQFAPVFIIGLPRSGTTLLYQSVIDQFELSYLNNKYKFLYGLPSLLARFSKRHDNMSFASHYGHVKGWNSPSEHFGIWRELFGENVANGTIANLDQLSPEEIERMRNVIFGLQNASSRSYVFKCLYLDLCVSALAEIFPSSRFIFVQRNIDAVRKSVLKGRMRHPSGRWWSVKVMGWEQMLNRPVAEQVEFQITNLSSILNEQVEKLTPARCYVIRYEDMIANIDVAVMELANWLGHFGILKRRGAESLATFVH